MDDEPSFVGLALDQVLPPFPGTQQGRVIDGEKLPHLLRKVAPFATKSRHTFGGTSIKAPLIRRNRETVAPDLV